MKIVQAGKNSMTTVKRKEGDAVFDLNEVEERLNEYVEVPRSKLETAAVIAEKLPEDHPARAHVARLYDGVEKMVDGLNHTLENIARDPTKTGAAKFIKRAETLDAVIKDRSAWIDSELRLSMGRIAKLEGELFSKKIPVVPEPVVSMYVRKLDEGRLTPETILANGTADEVAALVEIMKKYPSLVPEELRRSSDEVVEAADARFSPDVLEELNAEREIFNAVESAMRSVVGQRQRIAPSHLVDAISRMVS